MCNVVAGRPLGARRFRPRAIGAKITALLINRDPYLTSKLN
jgi:hypothetical protein